MPSLEGLSAKAKEAHEVRLALLGTNPVFQCLREVFLSQLFFHMLTLKALSKLNITYC